VKGEAGGKGGKKTLSKMERDLESKKERELRLDDIVVTVVRTSSECTARGK